MFRKFIIIMAIIMTTTCVYAEPDNSTDLEKLLTSNTFNTDSVTLDFRFDLPEYNILNHVTWNEWRNVPGAYQLEFVGIHKMFLSQVQRRIQHQAEDDLRRRWNTSNMPYSEFNTRMQGINSSYNPYGEWWERSWMHSLPIEKGGAPLRPVVEQIGWDIKITKNTPVVGWLKRQFDELGDIWISTDHEFDEERGTGVQRHDGRVDNNTADIGRLKVEETNIGIDRPWRWFESDFYHFRFKPTLKIASDSRTAFIDELALRVQTELFAGGKHFATVSFFVRHDFKDENTFFSVFFELVNF